MCIPRHSSYYHPINVTNMFINNHNKKFKKILSLSGRTFPVSEMHVWKVSISFAHKLAVHCCHQTCIRQLKKKPVKAKISYSVKYNYKIYAETGPNPELLYCNISISQCGQD